MHKELYDLTNPQRSIWLTEEFYKGTSIGNITGTVIISEKVNFKALEKAVNLLVKNNDSFRLKFIKKSNEVKQYVDSFVDFPIEIINVKTKKDIKKIENELSVFTFDIFNSFLFLFKFFRFENGEGGFVVSIHHLISDAWTSGFSINKVLKDYSSISKNKTILTDQVPSYIDYINSEKEYMKSQKFNTDKLFWNSIFETVPTPASIPSLLNSPSKLLSSSKRKQFTLPNETIYQIKEFCKNTKSSAYNFFMGVFSIYIGKISNLNDFVIGTPILNRLNFKDKNTTGMFISTVPVKISLNQENSFSDFVSNLSSEFFNIFRHQKYPYQYLLEDLRKTNSSIPNLYNIMISYQNIKSTSESSDVDYTSEWIPNKNISDDIDIHLSDMNDRGNMTISYDYRTSKYTINDICSMHARILHIINQILENTSLLLKDIEIVTPDEKEQILNKFNNTKTDYPKDKTISQLFEEQVQKTPDNVAVVFEDKSLTYKELNGKANSLANYLRRQKIGRNDLVGIMVNRSLEMIVAILAVLKSGATYIPIDPEYPEDRISYMLENSNAKFLLTFNSLKNKLSFDNKIFIELENSAIYSLNSYNLGNINAPEDSAYVIYTSGSTGKPKGVVLKHKNINNFIQGVCNEIPFDNNSVIVSVTTISFDIFVLESLLPLQKGSKIIIANENDQINCSLLNKLCVKNNVNIIQTTPSKMQLLVSDKNSLEFLSSLKFLLIGGEQFPSTLFDFFNSSCNAKIYNMYGPTETAVWSSMKNLSSEEITIGKPISNTYFYILNNSHNLLPVNCVGEIYIAGDGVGRGYLNNSELTNKSFINNPFSANSLMYKTGDLGYWNENGEVSCLGRADNQVKIRGLRIELEEIENKLLEIENITSCVVVKKISEDSHEFLCAYYTKRTPININNVREILKKQLPNYMVPQYFVELKSLPYTPNGKIDRKKLPEPTVNEKEEIVPARNAIDSKLISILQELLNLGAISIRDSFFNLGGDSLSAINLCTKIFNEFNVQLFVKDILENSIIENLSDVIAEKSGIIDSNTLVITKAAEKEFYPVSSAQKRMFFASSIAGNNNVLYNIAGSVILDKVPDVKKLEKCFNSLIQRHETLRTYFELSDTTVVQKIKNKVDFKLEVITSPISEKQIKNNFYQFVKPFDLSCAPLFRAKLMYLENNKCLLLIDMHHIISDGTSLNILVQELGKLYNNEFLPELQLSYKDFACFENSNIETDKLKEAEEFWLNNFAGEIPVLNMPTNFSRPAIQSYEGKKVYSSISSDLTDKINKISHNLSVTPYMLLLSCYYILLSKYTSQEDIIVGSPIVARPFAECYNLIGMFVNSLPLRNSVPINNSFSNFLNTVKANCLESYKYQDYPFDELVSKLNIKRDASRNPLFDTMFIYQNNGYPEINFNGITGKYFIPDSKISKFDLSLEIIPNSNQLELSFEYSTKLFEKEFIENLSNHYINILNSVLDNTDIKISDICMLSENEKNKILYEFNNTATNYPKDKTISQLFEEQVQKTPDNIAVVFQDKSLTYKELNEKANSLAAYLRTQKIGRNDLVGIMVNRSLEMLVAILGVLKSGGAYIPIDPEYPEDRISYMLENSNAKLLLTFNNLKDNVSFENTICIELENNNIYSLSNSNLENINEPEDSSYVIYTSGSTGKPKGVVLNQKALCNLSCHLNSYIPFFNNNSHQSIGSITTISFDIFIFETLLCLNYGLKVVISDEEAQHIPSKLNELIEKNKVQILQMTPSRMQIFIDNIADCPLLKSIQYVVLAGEPLPDALLANLLELGVKTVYNGYGPSETTVFSTFTDVTTYSSVNIGHPLSNTQVYILDKNLCPTPIGIPGELYIAGDGVGKGYLNNLELTSKAFIPNPFISNTLMYKTGDFCKFLNNGEIEYLERIDNQVKIRGLRIELGEIESKILEYPNISKVKVIKQTINNREFISAYFVSDKRIKISVLRKHLLEVLPKYMVPAYFTALDDFPYTPNGKIDKKALPLPTEFSNTSKEKYIAPKTDLEIKIVSIFEELLGVKPVGITDNFFELGGDSVLAMNLNIELIKLSNKISYADIFRFPTVLDLVNKINSEEETPVSSNLESSTKKYSYILNNNLKMNKIKYSSCGNILLTGVTGFLGAHILEAFIKNEKGNIYCLVRNDPGITANVKLQQKLTFYFGDKFNKLISTRIFAITGDITKENFGLDSEELQHLSNQISTVINSAAKVDHFGNYNVFYNTNVSSVKNMINFCFNFNKKFYQISTLSVSGNSFESSTITQNLASTLEFNESKLFINQSLDNVYVRSKFEAECAVLEAINNGLEAYIIRMGNLMPRYKDGVFQENLLDNAYINRIASFISIGAAPDYIQDGYLEFTPVDFAASAIIIIVTHSTQNNRIFHLFNHNHVYFTKCLEKIKELNPDFKILPEEDFKKLVKKLLNNNRKKDSLKLLINDFDDSLHLNYKTDIIIKSDFTIKYLNKLGFRWPKISKKYFNKFVEILKKVI